MLLSLLGAGMIAIAVFIATASVVILTRRENAETKAEYEAYKLTVGGKVADAKNEGIKAGKDAGDALVRAAELEKQAAELRKETAALELSAARLQAENLELQKIMLPRRLAGALRRDATSMLKSVQDQPSAVHLFIEELQGLSLFEVWIQSFPDFEAQTLAEDIQSVLSQAGVRTKMAAVIETHLERQSIPEGISVLVFRQKDGPQTGEDATAEFERPIVKTAAALSNAMRKAGLASKHFGVGVSVVSAANVPQGPGMGIPYFEGKPPEAIFVLVGVKPRTWELMMLQSRQQKPEASPGAAPQAK